MFSMPRLAAGRQAVLALLLSLACAATVALTPRQTLAITTVMNDHVVVRDDTVRLGDLFEGFDTAAMAGIAKQPAAQAPAPGERMVYDITRLAAIARAHQIDWRPRTWTDRVVVERASERVGHNAVVAAVRSEIARREGSRKFDIEFSSRAVDMHLPIDTRPTVAVQSLDIDERGGRFSAVVAAPADAPTTRLTVQGRLFETIDVPVLSRRLNAGEVIAAADLEWTPVRAEQVNRNVLTDAKRLIGQEVRRGMAPGQSVRLGDIRAPVLVAKGSIVTMHLQTPKMRLSSKGRALEDASMGDIVRIMNTQSKTVVEATVVGANTVEVTPHATLPN